MDLNATELFIAVVRAGSLSAASLETRVPLATLSRNVRQLEEQLGVQLLERTARGSKPHEGRATARHVCNSVPDQPVPRSSPRALPTAPPTAPRQRRSPAAAESDTCPDQYRSCARSIIMEAEDITAGA